MTAPTFIIPTDARYWRAIAPGVRTTSDEGAWARREAERALQAAAHLFRDTVFSLAKSPPSSQTYDVGSRNAEIKAFLEARTTLRFVR